MTMILIRSVAAALVVLLGTMVGLAQSSWWGDVGAGLASWCACLLVAGIIKPSMDDLGRAVMQAEEMEHRPPR